MKAFLPILLFVIIGLQACGLQQYIQVKTKDGTETVPQTKFYYLDHRQISTVFIPDEKVEPLEGEDNWTKRFYANLQYPQEARENEIQGFCTLAIKLNEFGTVLDFDVTQSPSELFVDEIKYAYSRTMPQYTPPVYNGNAIPCIMEIPVKFSLD